MKTPAAETRIPYMFPRASSLEPITFPFVAEYLRHFLGDLTFALEHSILFTKHLPTTIFLRTPSTFSSRRSIVQRPKSWDPWVLLVSKPCLSWEIHITDDIRHHNIYQLNSLTMTSMFCTFLLASHISVLLSFTAAASASDEVKSFFLANLLQDVVYIVQWLPTNASSTWAVFNYVRRC